MASAVHIFAAPHSSAAQLLAVINEQFKQGERYKVGLLLLSGEFLQAREWLAQALNHNFVDKWVIIASNGLVAQGVRSQNRNAALGLLFNDAETGGFSELNTRFEPSGFDTAFFFESESLDGPSLSLALQDNSTDKKIIGALFPNEFPALIKSDENLSFSKSIAILFSLNLKTQLISSSWIKLLTPFLKAQFNESAELTQLGKDSATDALAQLTAAQKSPLLVVLCEKKPAQLPQEYAWLDPNRDMVVTRILKGIDPTRETLKLQALPRQVSHLALGTPSTKSGESDLRSRLAALERTAGGAMPKLGLYFSSGQEQQTLSSYTDRDLGLIQERFPGLPFYGMNSPALFLQTQQYADWHRYARILLLFFESS